MADIVVRNIYKSYGEASVLSNVSAIFKQGTRTAIMGPSGCGKTTLLRIIAGLEIPDSGSISGISSGEFSMVFQEARLFSSMTALNNVKAVYENSELPKDLLGRIGFSQGDMNKKANELSGGMQRRVAVARALCYCYKLYAAKKTPILLLDEAVRELDETSAEITRQLIKEVADETQCTVISVTHNRSEAQRFYDGVLEM